MLTCCGEGINEISRARSHWTGYTVAIARERAPLNSDVIYSNPASVPVVH